MSNKSAFKTIARSVGYKLGKKRGRGQDTVVDFKELFSDPYDLDARLGFEEGVERARNGHTEDTWRTKKFEDLPRPRVPSFMEPGEEQVMKSVDSIWINPVGGTIIPFPAHRGLHSDPPKFQRLTEVEES